MTNQLLQYMSFDLLVDFKITFSTLNVPVFDFVAKLDEQCATSYDCVIVIHVQRNREKVLHFNVLVSN